jgi:cysteinyl-tRNA synthetase
MLRLYNTMSRSKEEFVPREPGKVKMFTCGPSIYRRPHLGNYRTFVYEDLLLRYLEYLDFKVDRIINFTDVEDKTILEADDQGVSIEELTGQVEQTFFEESKLLRMKLPSVVPRSSTCVDQAARLIQRLIDTGFAYWYGGNVFFDPLKYDGFGKLFRLDMSRWPKKRVRFKKDTYNGNRWNRGDFILWHGHKEGDVPFWTTEIGKGRPSWNIQDPAIITEHLGFQVDINCGGIDNIYRHHDYNIAVIESASGLEYARYYLHGGHLIVNGKSLSKSRGNILYPENVIEPGVYPHHIRFFLIYTHYRKQLNLTEARFESARIALNRFRALVNELSIVGDQQEKSNGRAVSLIEGIEPAFQDHMNDDLSMGRAFDAVVELLERLATEKAEGRYGAREKALLAGTIDRIDSVWKLLD